MAKWKSILIKLFITFRGFDFKEAAKSENAGDQRKRFYLSVIIKQFIRIHLCWMRDFSYSYNEPMAKRYFHHPLLAIIL